VPSTLDEGEIAAEGEFEDELAAANSRVYFSVGTMAAVSGRGVERGDAGRRRRDKRSEESPWGFNSTCLILRED